MGNLCQWDVIKVADRYKLPIEDSDTLGAPLNDKNLGPTDVSITSFYGSSHN